MAFSANHMQSPGVTNFLRFIRQRGIPSQNNINATASHIGSDSNRAKAPGLRNNICFPFMILGIQNFMRYSVTLKKGTQMFILCNGYGSNQNWLKRMNIWVPFLSVTEYRMK